MSETKAALSSSPGTLPVESTSASTSRCRAHLDNRFSGVWKSTGVTMVTRLLTRAGCSAA